VAGTLEQPPIADPVAVVAPGKVARCLLSKRLAFYVALDIEHFAFAPGRMDPVRSGVSGQL